MSLGEICNYNKAKQANDASSCLKYIDFYWLLLISINFYWILLIFVDFSKLIMDQLTDWWQMDEQTLWRDPTERGLEKFSIVMKQADL